MSVRIMLIAAAFVSPAAAQSFLPSPLGAPAPTATPKVLAQVGLGGKLGAEIPLDLPFTDDAGNKVTLRDCSAGRPMLLALVQYRCPMLCGQVLNGLVEAVREQPFVPGRQFEVVVVSIDSRETAALAAALKRHAVAASGKPESAEGWHFLTGSKDAVAALAAAVGYRFVYDEGADQFAHPAGVMLATAEGRLSHYFYGIQYPPRDLRLGLVEASANRIGTAADAVLLLCYHYDPETGKYGPAVMAMVRTGGVLTLAALGGFMWYASRRRAAAPE